MNALSLATTRPARPSFSGAILALGIVVACKTAPPVNHPSREHAGEGWICLADHPIGSFGTSCWRTEQECTKALEGRTARTPPCGRYSSEANRNATRVCVVSDRAACFEFMSSRGEKHVLCTRTMPACDDVQTRLYEPNLYREWVFDTLGGCDPNLEVKKKAYEPLERADVEGMRPLAGCQSWD